MSRLTARRPLEGPLGMPLWELGDRIGYSFLHLESGDDIAPLLHRIRRFFESIDFACRFVDLITPFAGDPRANGMACRAWASLLLAMEFVEWQLARLRGELLPADHPLQE